MKRLWWLAIPLVALPPLLWGVYRLGQRSAAPPGSPGYGDPAAVASRPAPGWAEYRDPAGVALHHPPGWTVRRDAASGRVDIAGPSGERIVVWPFFVRGTLDPARAAPALARMAARTWPEVRWHEPRGAGPTALRLSGAAGDRSAVAILSWVPSAKGTAGHLYLVGVPAARLLEARDAFARILGSVRVFGPPQEERTAAPALSFTRWRDPREGAFSLEVPAGWQVQGGLVRLASVDVRHEVVVVSPDRRIAARIGDARVPPFTLPHPTLAFAGFREGSWYSPGYGVRMRVRRFARGVDFAKRWARRVASNECADVRIVRSRPRPDAVQAVNAVYARFGGLGVQVRLSAGEVELTCTRAGRPVRGYAFAGTQLTRPQTGGGIWNVQYLYGWLADEEVASVAEQVLARMIASFELDPSWARMQQGLTARTSAIVSRTNAEISRLITSSYDARQRSLDEIARRRSNATLGVLDVVDPATSRELKVESGSNYYWIDPRGNVVGTETHTRPNLDFRELLQRP